VHNEYSQVLAELGMVGPVLLLALLAAVARMVWRGRDLVGTPATWAGVVAGLSALAAAIPLIPAVGEQSPPQSPPVPVVEIGARAVLQARGAAIIVPDRVT
jgi:hypothetical protein